MSERALLLPKYANNRGVMGGHAMTEASFSTLFFHARNAELSFILEDIECRMFGCLTC